MVTTSSDTTPTGKYLIRLPLPDTLAPTILFLENNLSVLASAATIIAPLTPLNITVTPNKMYTNYYSGVDQPQPELVPNSPRYLPSPIPFTQSPLLMSEKSSSPEIVAIQHNHAVQTDPHPFPHPIALAKLVKEHYSQPEHFLNIFHSTLDSLYSPPPHQHKRPSPDVFREVPTEHSTPILPRPKAAYSENKNPSLEDTILLQQLLND